MFRILHALALVCALAGPARADEPVLLSPQAAHDKAVAGELLLIDIRRPSEWAETGIGEGALALTMHGPDGLAGLAAAIDAATGGDRDAPIAVMCRSGGRSARASAWLAEHGFSAVHDVEGGILNWTAQQLPLTAAPAQ